MRRSLVNAIRYQLFQFVILSSSICLSVLTCRYYPHPFFEDSFLYSSLPKISSKVYITTIISKMITLILKADQFFGLLYCCSIISLKCWMRKRI